MDGSGYGNPDRGWNDPPKLAFCPKGTGTSAGPGRHRLLNKRVPIPVNPQPTTTTAQPPSLKASDSPPVKSGIPLHPPPVSACPPPSTTNPVMPCAGAPRDTLPTQELLEQVHSRLSDSLKSVLEKMKDGTHEEVRKRLDVMVDMWQKDLLSLEVQKRMQTLTEALSIQDYDKAWAIHQSLIVDYTTTCSPWMIGIKTLIAESRGRSEQDKLRDESNKESEVEEHTVPDADGNSPDNNASSIK